VGPKQDLVLIDTNIFVIELRYKRDTNFEVNRVFLAQIGDKGNGFARIAVGSQKVDRSIIAP
jgi:hypothetical protein